MTEQIVNGYIKQISTFYLDSIMNIERNSYARPWPPHVFIEELKNEWSTMWGFFPREKNTPVGFLLFWEIFDELHILNLAIHPDFRKQGVARSLMQTLIQYGKQNNFKSITLEVRRSNIPALRLYKSLGFQTVHIRKGYYTDNNEDAFIMALFLGMDSKEETEKTQKIDSASGQVKYNHREIENEKK